MCPKTYCPYSKKAKGVFAVLNPNPQPLIIEVDVRREPPALALNHRHPDTLARVKPTLLPSRRSSVT